MTVLLCCSCCAFKVCNVLLDYCLFILFVLSAYFFTHRLPLIEFNCLCSGDEDDDDDDAAWLWAIFMLSLLLLLLCATTTLSLLSSLNPLTGDHWFALCLAVCLPHSHCHSAFALFYRISLSFSGCLFVYISGKYFCFPLCAATPEGKRSKKQQAAVVCVCSHFHMNYVLHTYIFEYCMNAFKTANE